MLLAAVLYSILTGQSRCSHITAFRGDSVVAGLFGVETFRGEDSVRRALELDAITTGIGQQLDRTFAPLLDQKGVLDLDSTRAKELGVFAAVEE